MALNLYRWVCLGEDQQRLTKTIKWYILCTLMFTTTIVGPALGGMLPFLVVFFSRRAA
jgi:hypothetical protein